VYFTFLKDNIYFQELVKFNVYKIINIIFARRILQTHIYTNAVFYTHENENINTDESK